MNFFHSIKFRFTLWYLAILSILLILLGSGIYFTLSHLLHRNMDQTLKTRATQLQGFRDIISIVAGGTFEEENGELVSFYFLSDGKLDHVSHRQQPLLFDRALIDQAIKGHASFSTVEISPGRRLRVHITPFTPSSSQIDPDATTTRPAQQRISPQRQGSNDGPERQDQQYRPERQDQRYRPERQDQQYRPERQDQRYRPERQDQQYRPERQDQRYRPERPERFLGAERARQIREIRSAALVVARPTWEMEMALHRLLQILLVAGPLTILLSAGGGMFLARRAFKPVEEIAKTARVIEESDLGRRIEVKTKDELGNLAATLNQMIDRLEKAFRRQKDFTGDASHELRAPLAIIQAEATLTLQKERTPEEYEKSIAVISQEADRMSALINQLLTLARADAGKEQLKLENLDLSPFIRDLCCDVEILCREKGIGLRLDLPATLPVKGDGRSLRRLMYNLLDNAIRHTGEDGTISVMLQEIEGRALLSVADTGTGIPTEALPHIFERFYRVDKARSRADGGSGLGLALCRHITAAHGGTIEAESRVGKGSTFRVTLPLFGA